MEKNREGEVDGEDVYDVASDDGNEEESDFVTNGKIKTHMPIGWDENSPRLLGGADLK